MISKQDIDLYLSQIKTDDPNLQHLIACMSRDLKSIIDENGYLKQNTYLSSNLITKDKMVHTYVSDGTNCEKANFTVDTQYEKEKLPILKEENGKFYVAEEGINQYGEHYGYWCPISKELYLFLKNKGADKIMEKIKTIEEMDKIICKRPTAQEIGILPLPLWNLTKCYTGEIMNGLQISYGNKNITILITDDLYLELKKLTEAPKEDIENE